MRRRSGLTGAGAVGRRGRGLQQRGDAGSGVGAHQPVGPANRRTLHLREAVEVAQEVLPFLNEVGLAQGKRSSKCSWIASARNEQKTWPGDGALRMKIGRAPGTIVLVRPQASSYLEEICGSGYRREGPTFASVVVRNLSCPLNAPPRRSPGRVPESAMRGRPRPGSCRT